jgi:hypothetical protein
MEKMHNEDTKKWSRETKPKWEATRENITLTEIGVMDSNTKGTAIAVPFVLFRSGLSYWQFSRWGVDSEVRMVSSG